MVAVLERELGQYLEENHKKKVSIESIPGPYPYRNHARSFEVIENVADSPDSFRKINFPSLRAHGNLYVPFVSLEGLDAHLKAQGLIVEGPEVLHQGLLAEQKYSKIDFQATQGHAWKVYYQVPYPSSGPLDLVVEAGWRRLDFDSRFTFVKNLDYSDENIETLKTALSGITSFNHRYEFKPLVYLPKRLEESLRALHDGPPVYVATATDYDPLLGIKSGWKPIKSMDLEEFSGLIWTRLVQNKPLRTAIMTVDELEWLAKEAEEKARKESELKLKEEVTLRKYEAMHSEIAGLLRQLITSTGQVPQVPHYNPNFLESDEGSEMALTETTIDAMDAGTDGSGWDEGEC